MKKNIWFNGVALLLTACLLTSCTHTVTWRDIRKDPARYMKEDQAAIKGRVDSVWLPPQADNGELVVRDCNGDSGRVEFRDRRGVRSRGDKVVVTGKIHKAQRDTSAEYYMVLDKLKDATGWWVAPANIVLTPIVVGVAVGADAAFCVAAAYGGGVAYPVVVPHLRPRM